MGQNNVFLKELRFFFADKLRNQRSESCSRSINCSFFFHTGLNDLPGLSDSLPVFLRKFYFAVKNSNLYKFFYTEIFT